VTCDFVPFQIYDKQGIRHIEFTLCLLYGKNFIRTGNEYCFRNSSFLEKHAADDLIIAYIQQHQTGRIGFIGAADPFGKQKNCFII
jgi:hypothetical protein